MQKHTRKRTPAEQRFMKYVNQTDGCWLWTGGNNGKYGVFYAGPDSTPMRPYAHRWSYAHFVGPIPEGMEINHRCEVPLCVLPAHLEVTTHTGNMNYGSHPAAQKARQTECIHGHAFTEANTYVKPNGTRGCRHCRRLRQAEYRERRLSKSV
jgi:hypothetical protein